MTGTLDVLNCGSGHTTIAFDKDDPDEAKKAKKIIQDMLKRGYAIFVELPDGLHKVSKFDPDTEEYIIQDPPKPPRRAKMKTTKATGVGRTAGG